MEVQRQFSATAVPGNKSQLVNDKKLCEVYYMFSIQNSTAHPNLLLDKSTSCAGWVPVDALEIYFGFGPPEGQKAVVG